jgi:uncharacterized membrane protein
MRHVSHGFQIDAPRMQVWDKAADCSLLPQWNVSYTRIKDCSGRLDRVGASYTAFTRILGREIEGPWEVIEVDPGRKVVTRGAAAGGALATITTVFTDSGEGTHLQVEIDYELPGGFISGPLERLVGPSVERDIRHSSENFKAICEAMVATPA